MHLYTVFISSLISFSWGCLLVWPGLILAQQDTLTEVNGVPVYQAEMELFMSASRAQVVRSVTQQHNVSFGKGFWEQEIEGQTPTDYLTQRSLEAMLPYKVQQAWMIQLGLMDRWDWGRFCAAYQAYNRQRHSAYTASKVLYGPVSLSLMDYYTHYFTHYQAALRREMVKAGMLESDSIKLYDALLQEEIARNEGCCNPLDQLKTSPK